MSVDVCIFLNIYKKKLIEHFFFSERVGRPIDIEAGEPVQIDVPKNKFDKFIKKYLLQENDNVTNCAQFVGPVFLFLIIIVTIVTTSSFGLYYYNYPYF